MPLQRGFAVQWAGPFMGVNRVPQKLPYMNPAGMRGFVWIEDRAIKVEFPDYPKFDNTIDLTGIDLDRLAGQILDLRDAEANALRRRACPQTE